MCWNNLSEKSCAIKKNARSNDKFWNGLVFFVNLFCNFALVCRIKVVGCSYIVIIGLFLKTICANYCCAYEGPQNVDF